jgi:type I restriction enzyme M protein
VNIEDLGITTISAWGRFSRR